MNGSTDENNLVQLFGRFISRFKVADKPYKDTISIEAIFERYKDATERDDKEAIAEAMAQVWEYLGQEESEPSPWLEAMNRAHAYEALHDWVEAERAFREAVAASDAPPALQSGALGALSAMFNLIGEEEKALKTASESLALARISDDPCIALKSALARESILRFRRGELEAAHALLYEEIEIIQANWEVMKASWPEVVLRGTQYHLRSGDLEAVKNDLDAVWPMLEEKREWAFLTSYQARLADWWETKAELCALQNNLNCQIDALREVVHYREIVSQAPQLEGPYKFNKLAQAWFALAKALRSVKSPEAEEAFKRSAEIRCAIGLFPLE